MKSQLLCICFLLGLAACSDVMGDPSSTDLNDVTGSDDLSKSDAWNSVNDPERFLKYLDEELVYTIADLPLEGAARKKAWPASYWPTYEDSTNARWLGPDQLSPMEKYDLVFNNWVPPTDFMALKPRGGSCAHSDFDPAYYEAIGPAARWMTENRGHWRTHDGLDNDNDGTIDECAGHEGIDTWWGLCHAWTPASILEDEPL